MTRRALACAALVTAGLTACSSGAHAARHTATTRAQRAVGSSSSTTAPAPPPATVRVTVAPWSLPHALAREVVVPVGSELFVLGGTAAGGTTASVVTIDTATGAVRADGSLAAAVHDAAGAAIGGRPVVFGGGSSATTDVVQEPGRVIGHLPVRRADVSAATSVDGAVYVVGGYDGTSLVPDVLTTRDGVTFRTVARLPVPVRYPAVAIVGGKLFVVGGATSGGENAGVDTNAVQVVDLATGAASVIARMPQTRSHATAVTIGGGVYVLGGHVAGAWSDDVSQLDPATGALHTVAHLPRALSDAGAAVIGSSAYLVGGETAPSSYLSGAIQLTLG